MRSPTVDVAQRIQIPRWERQMDLEEIDAVAAGQYGLVTSSQAIAAIGRGRKERWTKSGRLIRVQPRVSRMAGSPGTWQQHLKAAQLSSGGLVSHRSASQMWGLRRPDDIVEVEVDWHFQPRLWPPAVVHRSTDVAQTESVEREGLLITDPVRTIVDLGLVVPPSEVASALDIALGRRLLRVEDLRRLRSELSKCGRDGVGVVGDLLDQRWPSCGKEESPLETRFLSLLMAHHLAEPTVQHEIWHRGRFVARVDAAYPAIRLAIELDGFEHHSSFDAFQRDRSRQNELTALGWTVLRFTWEDVVRRPASVTDTIRAALRRLSDSACA
jgi:very-short-patch-repair endonuclease